MGSMQPNFGSDQYVYYDKKKSKFDQTEIENALKKFDGVYYCLGEDFEKFMYPVATMPMLTFLSKCQAEVEISPITNLTVSKPEHK